MSDLSIPDGIKRPTIGVDLRALVGPPSGIGYFTISMLQELQKIGSSNFVGMAHRAVSSEATEELSLPIQIQRARLGVWWLQVTLPKRLSQGDIDLLWSPLSTMPRKCPVPGVVTIHDLTVVLHPETHRLKVRWSVVPFLSTTVEMARRIAVDSIATADDLVEQYPGCADRIEVVYPGVDREFSPATDQEIQATRESLDCPDGYVLYAGTIEPRKNIDALITAWQKYREAGRRIPLVLCGPYGWHSNTLMKRIEQFRDQDLIYLGRLDRHRLVSLMQAASVFVYPSLYEGFGLPPAEAMASGVPTITSDRSSLPEIVGDAGILVDPEDTDRIATAIKRILTEPSLADDLRSAGQERVKRFSWASAARSMDQLFMESLS